MNKERLYKILLSPRVTEKSARVGEAGNQYVFQVVKDANKAEIKAAVEMLFGVNVISLQVVNMKGKTKSFKFRSGKRNDWKKAYVRLEQGQHIDLVEGDSA